MNEQGIGNTYKAYPPTTDGDSVHEQMRRMRNEGWGEVAMGGAVVDTLLREYDELKTEAEMHFGKFLGAEVRVFDENDACVAKRYATEVMLDPEGGRYVINARPMGLQRDVQLSEEVAKPERPSPKFKTGDRVEFENNIGWAIQVKEGTIISTRPSHACVHFDGDNHNTTLGLKYLKHVVDDDAFAKQQDEAVIFPLHVEPGQTAEFVIGKGCTSIRSGVDDLHYGERRRFFEFAVAGQEAGPRIRMSFTNDAAIAKVIGHLSRLLQRGV